MHTPHSLNDALTTNIIYLQSAHLNKLTIARLKAPCREDAERERGDAATPDLNHS